tara:strand:- start:53 stop:280 length:228 start_codon:yes stop_codon:yes gene_type:complete
MTDEQRTKLDSKMHEFDSFNDFHDFAYENDIYFDIDEWEEYSDKMKKIISDGNTAVVDVNLDNLILPKSFEIKKN